jgi:hypothetical protein
MYLGVEEYKIMNHKKEIPLSCVFSAYLRPEVPNIFLPVHPLKHDVSPV